MIIGLGSDLIDIRRVEKSLERFGDRFVRRVFTEIEQAKSDRRRLRAASYAKRFAAKEACAKALGTGLSKGVFWRDMGVVNLPGGKPTMHLTGGAAVMTRPIQRIVFACDAGMGSSAMGASVLRKKIEAAGYSDVTVVNQAIGNLTDEYDVIVCHQDLADRAAQRTPSATLVAVDNFMASPRYDEIVTMVGDSRA